MQIIVNQLVVLISPVLSFTAEEIWQGNDFLLAKADSVFLTTLKDLESFNSDLSNADWKRMLEIKEDVNQGIEESRAAGVIKGSLDASIELILNADDFNLANKFASEMHFFLIVSECNILQGDSFKISVSQSSAEKCVRCWHRNQSVGSSSKHPELCNRCVENLDGPGEDRKFA